MTHVALIGMPGSGKSSTGLALATESGLAHRDLDTVVAERTGATPSEMIRTEGESAFRSIEMDTLADVLAGEEAIIAQEGASWSRRAAGSSCAALTSSRCG